MILEFTYFPGDEVINLEQHMDAQNRTIRVDNHGRVVHFDRGNNKVTVSWFGETQDIVLTTTTVDKKTIRPYYTAPESTRARN